MHRTESSSCSPTTSVDRSARRQTWTATCWGSLRVQMRFMQRKCAATGSALRFPDQASRCVSQDTQTFTLTHPLTHTLTHSLAREQQGEAWMLTRGGDRDLLLPVNEPPIVARLASASPSKHTSFSSTYPQPGVPSLPPSFSQAPMSPPRGGGGMPAPSYQQPSVAMSWAGQSFSQQQLQQQLREKIDGSFHTSPSSHPTHTFLYSAANPIKEHGQRYPEQRVLRKLISVRRKAQYAPRSHSPQAAYQMLEMRVSKLEEELAQLKALLRSV
jgi:hypothetical protein